MEGWIISLIFIIFVFMFITILAVYHLPNSKLNEHDIKMITQNGLIHFTEENSIQGIIKDGLTGNVSKMSKLESMYGKIVWFYIYDPQENQKHLELIKTKHNKSNYNCGIVLEKFGEYEFEKMRIRKGFGRDMAVIYKTDRIRGHNMRTWFPK